MERVANLGWQVELAIRAFNVEAAALTRSG
jgi:hypothetical protein